MKRLLFSLLFIFAFASCVNVDYIGRTYPRTQNVEIFFSSRDVGREYVVMGKISVEGGEGHSFETLQSAMMRKARSKGADGVLLDNMEKRNLGSNSVTVGARTRGSHVGVGASRTSTSRDTDNLLEGVLIKYK